MVKITKTFLQTEISSTVEIFSHLYSDFLQKAYHVYNIKALLSQNCFQKYWSMLHMTVIDFPLIRNGITSGVCAMDGLLKRILHWYILECSLLQTPAALCIGKIWSCPDTNPVFRHGLSTVVVKTPCDFLCNHCGAVRLTCLVCIQGCVVTPKCLLPLWMSTTYSDMHQPEVSISHCWPMQHSFTLSDFREGVGVSYVLEKSYLVTTCRNSKLTKVVTSK